MRKMERVEKERMKDIANKAKAVSMRRKYQTSNYTSYAINGDSSIPVVPLNKSNYFVSSFYFYKTDTNSWTKIDSF